MTPYSACINFSGITVRFCFPDRIALPNYLKDLQCEDSGIVDEQYDICLINTLLKPSSPPVHTHSGIDIYQTDKGWLRIYSSRVSEDGCQIACLLCLDGNNKLYIPRSLWPHYAADFHCLAYIGGEVLLLKYNALLLHSSVVMHKGKTILFSGPSGAGKSTQADLWVRHLNAELINGDRCVIREQNGTFWGGGSPWCGTSGIHRKECAPIAGIFLVHQAPENRVNRLGFESFAPLLSQTIVNSWDPSFMEQAAGLFIRLLSQVPVYRLDCRPDEQAVDLAFHSLFSS